MIDAYETHRRATQRLVCEACGHMQYEHLDRRSNMRCEVDGCDCRWMRHPPRPVDFCPVCAERWAGYEIRGGVQRYTPCEHEVPFP